MGSRVEWIEKNEKPQVGFEHTTCRLRSGCSTNWAIEAPVRKLLDMLMRSKTMDWKYTLFRLELPKRDNMAEDPNQSNDPSELLFVEVTFSVCCQKAESNHFCSYRNKPYSENTSIRATSKGTPECSLLSPCGWFAEAYSRSRNRERGSAEKAHYRVDERSLFGFRWLIVLETSLEVLSPKSEG